MSAKKNFSSHSLSHACYFGCSLNKQDPVPPTTNPSDAWLKNLESIEQVSFNKDEVNDMMMNLSKLMTNNETLENTNRFLRRAFAAAGVVFLLMSSSILGLSYAFVVVGSKMDVDATSGVMTTMDGKHVVATDSVSYKVMTTKNEATGKQCVDHVAFGELIQRVESGHSVTVEMFGTGELGTETQFQKLSGSFTAEDGEICFSDSTGKQLVCVTPSSDCAVTEPTAGRRLGTPGYIATCKAFASTVPEFVFGAMLSKASVCIKNKCSGSIISSNPPQYKATSCVCECASSAGVSFAFSFSTRKP